MLPRRLRNMRASTDTEFLLLISLTFIAFGLGVLEEFLNNRDRGAIFLALAMAFLANARISQMEGDLENIRSVRERPGRRT